MPLKYLGEKTLLKFKKHQHRNKMIENDVRGPPDDQNIKSF